MVLLVLQVLVWLCVAVDSREPSPPSQPHTPVCPPLSPLIIRNSINSVSSNGNRIKSSSNSVNSRSSTNIHHPRAQIRIITEGRIAVVICDSETNSAHRTVLLCGGGRWWPSNGNDSCRGHWTTSGKRGTKHTGEEGGRVHAGLRYKNYDVLNVKSNPYKVKEELKIALKELGDYLIRQKLGGENKEDTEEQSKDDAKGRQQWVRKIQGGKEGSWKESPNLNHSLEEEESWKNATNIPEDPSRLSYRREAARKQEGTAIKRQEEDTTTPITQEEDRRVATTDLLQRERRSPNTGEYEALRRRMMVQRKIHQGLLAQSLDPSTPSLVRVHAGGDALLLCRVQNLGGLSVTWTRLRDYRVVAIDTTAMVRNQRLSPSLEEQTETWLLRIKGARRFDASDYECKVSTRPPLSKVVTLRVVPQGQPLEEDAMDQHQRSVNGKPQSSPNKHVYGRITNRHKTQTQNIRTQKTNICIFIYIHTYIQSLHTYRHTSMHTYICIRKYIHTCINKYGTYVHACIQSHSCIYTLCYAAYA